MKLRELLKGCDYTPSLTLPTRGEGQRWGDMDISGVAYDSRKVKEGHLFVAITGGKLDGHDFIKDAIEKGAVAIVHEHNNSEFRTQNSQCAICFIPVRESRKTLACIANNYYGMPSESLTLAGITGTNGKTTTTYILKSILESWGKDVGLIGTIQYMIKDRIYPALHTTPESLEFQKLLKDMSLSGCAYVISEVSSHALAQHRVDGAIFRAGVFTNLTRDHLDFHKTMEDYYRSKERLFTELLDENGAAAINLDDPYGRRLISSITARRKPESIVTYGLTTGADIMANAIYNTLEGLRFKILFRGRSYEISSRLIGLPNVHNIMSAVSVSISLAVPWQVILDGVEKAGNVAGRFEKVDIGQSFLCMIDYAHTEDALERLILTARDIVLPTHPLRLRRIEGENRGDASSNLRDSGYSPRVITVFGCGGDRDRGKRPGMGAAATRLSDFVIITSDNPRSEEPSAIIKEIESGTVNKNYLIEPDRKKAIRRAVNMAEDGDVLLVAGKGHEDYQEVKDVRYKFSDRDVLEEAIMLKRQDTGCRMRD